MTSDEQNNALAGLGFGDGFIELGEDCLAACRSIKQKRLYTMRRKPRSRAHRL
jgi:hypothetical protein